ncbi:hypothetical protein PIB30_039640 [Stylosanthes scabra]|uniref:Glycine-rich protein n=1 Tax=Stylosanthes scabra TaxID=79078 RepID=A0ABU6SF40_9FABA|nr:hypothetical protein [Stylosanthes scabra]
MMSSFKTYLSFVLLLAFVLSSHVLTHELPQEDINNVEVDPLEELTSDSSIGYKPKGDWGLSIGPEPNDEFDEDYSGGGRYNSGRRYRNYNSRGGSRGYSGHRRGGDDDYDNDDDDFNDRSNYHNRRRFKGYSSEFVQPQSLSLQNTKLKNYNLDGSIKKHRKIMVIPSKFDTWNSIPHKDGNKKGLEGVEKKTMN